MYGENYATLMRSGAGRFIQGPELSTRLVDLASSNISIDKQLETLYTANDQIYLRQQVENFKKIPKTFQPSEFANLPPTTQQMMLSAGYELPDKKQDERPWWQRALTWDIPLNPFDNWLDDRSWGTPLALPKAALAPVKAVGAGLGFVGSTLWEGIEKSWRAGQRFGRSLLYLEELGSSSMFKPPKWREAWNNTRLENDSYSKDTIADALELVGPDRTKLLRMYIAQGNDAVAEYFADEMEARGRPIEDAINLHSDWYESLAREDSQEALAILQSNKLDTFNGSIRMYNKYVPFLPDAAPDSKWGKVVGTTGSLATGIILDPTTWLLGPAFSAAKLTKLGIRNADAWKTIDLAEQYSRIVRAHGGKLPRSEMAKLSNTHDELMKEWSRSHKGLRAVGLLNPLVRMNANARNRFIEKVNETFDKLNRTEDARIAIRDEMGVDATYAKVEEELLKRHPDLAGVDADALLEEFTRLIPGMEQGLHHMIEYNLKVRLDDGWITATGQRVKPQDLSTYDGFWNFLKDDLGARALSSKMGGVDPDAIFIPRLTFRGASWQRVKTLMDQTVDFGKNSHTEITAGVARLSGEFLQKQDYTAVALLMEDIDNGVLTLSKEITGEQLGTLLKIRPSQLDERASMAETIMGFTKEDVTKITDRHKYLLDEGEIFRRLIDDGEVSDLLNYYKGDGRVIDETGKIRYVQKGDVLPKGWWRAARNYYTDNIPPQGSFNAEVGLAEKLKVFSLATATSMAYYPAKFARSLITYVPKAGHLDRVDALTSISEFKALVKMGSLAHMPRAQINSYIRKFITGNEAERWIVSSEFLLDFVGRSGILLHAGDDVTQFVDRFIRHGSHHYDVLRQDGVSVFGMSAPRGIFVSDMNLAQMSRMNVIPNYRELAAVAKYINMYKRFGWATPIPWIDKWMGRIWRPAVLLRLGYVARNGGEELFSWMLREGPGNYVKSKMARTAAGKVIVWDEYGRKMVKNIDELADTDHRLLIGKPFGRLIRSVNEIAGVGDYAITRKALANAIKGPEGGTSGIAWGFKDEATQLAAFEFERARLIRDMDTIPRMARWLQANAHKLSNYVSRRIGDTASGMGIPSKQQLMANWLRKIDADADRRIADIQHALSNPTMMDAVAKDILNTHDTYLNFSKNSLDTAMRDAGFGQTLSQLVKLPVDYSTTQLRVVQNNPGQSPEYILALAQSAEMHGEDVGVEAAMHVMNHFVNPEDEAKLAPLINEMIAQLPTQGQREFHVGRAEIPARHVPASKGGIIPAEGAEITEQALQAAKEAEPITVMITGQRFWKKDKATGKMVRAVSEQDEARIKKAIDDSLAQLPPGSTVRVGGARGVDEYAEQVANRLGLNVEQYYIPDEGAESWTTAKAKAGPIRNKRMLEGRPIEGGERGLADKTWAFHSGKGFETQEAQKTLDIGKRSFILGKIKGLGRDAENPLKVAYLPYAAFKKMVGGTSNMPPGFHLHPKVLINQVIAIKSGDQTVLVRITGGAIRQGEEIAQLLKNDNMLISPRFMQEMKKPKNWVKKGSVLDDNIKNWDPNFPDGGPRAVELRFEYIGPQTNPAEVQAGLKWEGGTADAMNQSLSAGVKIDTQANFGKPEIAGAEELAEVSAYNKAKGDASRRASRDYDEVTENGVTRLTVYDSTTATKAEDIPAIPGIEPKTPMQSLLYFLDQLPPRVKRILEANLDEARRGSHTWQEVVNSVLSYIPYRVRHLWHDILMPPVDGVIRAPRYLEVFREETVQALAIKESDLGAALPARTARTYGRQVRDFTGASVFEPGMAQNFPMNFDYGQRGALPKAAHITSDDTFTAILDGQRTATTRKDIQVEGVKVGDYLKFTKTKHGVQSEPIYVRVTEVRKTDTLTPEEWALPEGYSPKAAAENWTPSPAQLYKEQRMSHEDMVKHFKSGKATAKEWRELDDEALELFSKMGIPVPASRPAKVYGYTGGPYGEGHTQILFEMVDPDTGIALKAQPQKSANHRQLEEGGANIDAYPAALRGEFTIDELLEELSDFWWDAHYKQNKATGPKIIVVGEVGESYGYTGKRFNLIDDGKSKPGAKLSDERPMGRNWVESDTQAGWPPAIARILKRVEEETGYKFDIAIIQRYDSGSVDLGWHYDRLPDGSPEEIIASVNFGETRNFQFRPRWREDGKEYGYKTDRSEHHIDMPLEDGDIFLMREGTQENWEHRVTRGLSHERLGPRINITFRRSNPAMISQARLARVDDAEKMVTGRNVTQTARITPELLRANPDTVYLFGDNIAGKGKAGQAVIRDEPNAYGIPTKHEPNNKETSFFSDRDFEKFTKAKIDEAFARIPEGANVVYSTDGIGTGLAQLPSRAPKTYEYIMSKLKELAGPDARRQAQVVTEVHYNKGLNTVLSNFHQEEFVFRGVAFSTAEGAYQAWKTGDYVPGFENLTGKSAKAKGRKLTADTDTNTELMREILQSKFDQSPAFREELLASGQITHPVKDTFWASKFPELLEELKGSVQGTTDHPLISFPSPIRGVTVEDVANTKGHLASISRGTAPWDPVPNSFSIDLRAIEEAYENRNFSGTAFDSLKQFGWFNADEFVTMLATRNIVPSQLSDAERFVELVNLYGATRGIDDVITLDTPLTDQFALMAYIWETQMSRLRYGHTTTAADNVEALARANQANMLTFSELGIPIPNMTDGVPRTNQSTQIAHWLFGNPGRYKDVSRLHYSEEALRDAMHKAYVGAHSTPEGQQAHTSAVRSNISTDPAAPYISHAIPDSVVRGFVPMVPTSVAEDLTSLMIADPELVGAANKFHQIFQETLTRKLDEIGGTGPKRKSGGVVTASQLLNPAVSIKGARNSGITYMKLAEQWADAGHFPLVTASTDPMVAKAIAESVVETIAEMKGVPVEQIGLPRIATKDLHGDEFFNKPGYYRREREKNAQTPDWDLERGGLTSTESNASFGDIRTMNHVYGFATDGRGVVTSAQMGDSGLRGETVFGIGAHRLSPFEGLTPVPMSTNGEYQVSKKIIARHKDGLRPNAIIDPDNSTELAWYKPDEWDLEEQIFSGPTIHNAISETGQLVIDNLLHTYTNQSRRGGTTSSLKVFHPWVDEVINDAPVDAGRMQANADSDGWWNSAPQELVGFAPAEAEDQSAFYLKLFRGFFDGVVHPMLGAMVREPLFHDYLTKGMKQTEGFRQAYFHAPDRFKTLNTRLGKISSVDDNKQLVINGWEDFVKQNALSRVPDADDPVTGLFYAIESRSQKGVEKHLDVILNGTEETAPLSLSPQITEFLEELYVMASSNTKVDAKLLDDFFSYNAGLERQLELWRDTGLQRAMTLTSSFIDDHRIRSNFQTMVNTAVPFWFAEDTFLRRFARGLAHNPLMLRNLNLFTGALRDMGVVQKDQHGNHILVIPYSGDTVGYVMELADKMPVVNRVFGGNLGSVAKPNLASSLHVIPGYDLDRMGQMGFGPLLSIPINLVANIDSTIRKTFENNLSGGRFTPENRGEVVWSAVVPQVIARPVSAIMDGFGFESKGKIKAQMEVIKYLGLHGQLPTPEEIASQPNPEVFMERFMDKVAQMGRQYSLLQTMSWWAGPATARLHDLMNNEAFERNQDLWDLVGNGVPWEEAYGMWMEKIIAEEGEFDPFVHTPFMVGTHKKGTVAVLETTEQANDWIVDNNPFINNFPNTAAFFMDRGFDSDDDDYEADAKARLVAHGLLELQTPVEYLNEVYYKSAMPQYQKMKTDYLEKKYALLANKQDTSALDRQWDADNLQFMTSNPVFAKEYQGGRSRDKREASMKEIELLVNNPDKVPEGPYKADLLLVMGIATQMEKDLFKLKGQTTGEATELRNNVKVMVYLTLRDFVRGKPWLNEIYYSLVLPLLGENFVAKFENGLIKV